MVQGTILVQPDTYTNDSVVLWFAESIRTSHDIRD